MVKYYDDRGVYDAPVAKVWELLKAHTDENTPKMHPDFVAVRTLSEKEGVVEREIEVSEEDGSMQTMRLRFTAKPPYTMGIDYLTGPFAGSWVTNTYVPEGDRTRVVCTGDFHGQGMDDATVLDIASAMLDQRFEEDASYLHDHV